MSGKQRLVKLNCREKKRIAGEGKEGDGEAGNRRGKGKGRGEEKEKVPRLLLAPSLVDFPTNDPRYFIFP